MSYEFKPRTPRYRLFANGQMWEPGGFSIFENGNACTLSQVSGFEFNIALLPDGVLLQSTGLTDAEGVEVFEGDIISYDDVNAPVEYEHGAFWIGPTIALHELASNGRIGDRVVGNVFEHAHLLTSSARAAP